MLTGAISVRVYVDRNLCVYPKCFRSHQVPIPFYVGLEIQTWSFFFLRGIPCVYLEINAFKVPASIKEAIEPLNIYFTEHTLAKETRWRV